MYVQCVRVNVVADNTICAQMETHTYTYTNSHKHMYNKQNISYFIQIYSRTEECNVKRQSLPKEDDGGSCVP